MLSVVQELAEGHVLDVDYLDHSGVFPMHPTTSDIDITVLTGRHSELITHVTDLARLRIDVFREFPYLYDGNPAYEETYLATYVQCPDSVIVLARDHGRVIGASTGIPLAAEVADFQQPFQQAGHDPQTIFYCGESVLRPEYRGRGVYRHFFQEREKHARSLKSCTHIFFCAVVRPDDHPRRPAGYVPLDRVWNHFGYQKFPELVTTFLWKDLDDDMETPKPMVFWGKTL